MGYTHYWEAKPIHSIITWTAIVSAVQAICVEAKKENIKISGWDGEGDPEFLLPFGNSDLTRIIASNCNDEDAWSILSDRRQDNGSRLGEWVAVDLAIAKSDVKNKNIPLPRRAMSNAVSKDTEKLFKRRMLISDLYKKETDLAIRLNGYKDESCETFYINRYPENRSFCKTQRMPYDTVVVASLLMLNHIAGIEIESDGGPENWQSGLNLAKRLFPEIEIPSTI